MSISKTARVFAKPRPTYRTFLTPSQSEEMGRFLIALTSAGERATQAGIKPDVSAAIKAWSEKAKTSEERNADRTWKYREQREA